MKCFYKILTVLLALTMIAGCLVSCTTSEGNPDATTTSGSTTGGSNDNQDPGPVVDYAADLKFDKNSGRKWTEVTVKTFVDGDTTHFNVPTSVNATGILKARYLAINTPESTGQIEPWGKKASNYTKNALSGAVSIIIESDTAQWNLDSTGDRYLVWVWYKTAEMTDYRNLNLEILQSGLCIASNSSQNSYGELCMKALNQAITHKLYCHSKEKDPDFYYGSAIPLTLKELKTNIESYKDKRVSFEGVVVKKYSQTVYVEEYDEETGLYFGMQVYYGFGLDFFGEEVLTVGNRIMVVGSVQYYETGGTYQISDIKYNSMKPDHEDNIKTISSGHSASFREYNVADLTKSKVTLDISGTDENGNEVLSQKDFDLGFIALHSSASLQNLTILSIYTTQEGNSKGAMSITCKDANGNEIVLRTEVLKNSDGTTVTEAAFPVGSVINAKGIIDVFDGEYQLGIYSTKDITFVNN